MRVTDLPALPIRPDDGHKGTFGRAMLIGGSVGMSGSIALSGMAALRSGAGLVYLAVPQPILPIVAGFDPSYLTVSLHADDRGQISEESLHVIEGKLLGMDVCAVGPGLGTSYELDQIVGQLYRNQHLPVVLDADALNCLANMRDVLPDHSGPRILTPHPGEFARLIDVEIKQVQQNREELSVEFAMKNQLVLVLKGPETIVTDGDQVYVNTTGNSGMGTGGTGDVLTGIIVALVGQGMSLFEAAQLGVYVHGLSGDLCAQELTKFGLIASDMLRFLPRAWRRIEER